MHGSCCLHSECGAAPAWGCWAPSSRASNPQASPTCPCSSPKPGLLLPVPPESHNPAPLPSLRGPCMAAALPATGLSSGLGAGSASAGRWAPHQCCELTYLQLKAARPALCFFPRDASRAALALPAVPSTPPLPGPGRAAPPKPGRRRAGCAWGGPCALGRCTEHGSA